MLSTIQIYNLYFDCANFFKNIFKLFSKVLNIKEKKQQLTAHKQKHKSNRKSQPYLCLRLSAKRYYTFLDIMLVISNKLHLFAYNIGHRIIYNHSK